MDLAGEIKLKRILAAHLDCSVHSLKVGKDIMGGAVLSYLGTFPVRESQYYEVTENNTRDRAPVSHYTIRRVEAPT